MAGTSNAIRAGVKAAHAATKSVQGLVQFEKFVSDGSGYGVGEEVAAVRLTAVINYNVQQVRTTSGELVACKAVLTFLDVAALRRATNGEGILTVDKVTLPDGRTGPIYVLNGVSDPVTGLPFVTKVALG